MALFTVSGIGQFVRSFTVSGIDYLEYSTTGTNTGVGGGGSGGGSALTNIRIGSTTPSAIYVGSTQVTEVYVGSTKVWG